MSVASKVRAAIDGLDMYEPDPRAVLVDIGRAVSGSTLDAAVKAAGADSWDRDHPEDTLIRVWL